MKNFDKIGIVIHGPLYDEESVEIIIEKYKNLKKNCVISTWVDQPNLFIERLRLVGFSVIAEEKPEFTGNHNCNLQIVASKNGIEFLSERRLSHILRIRTDLVPNNVEWFIEELYNLTLEKLIFLYWINRYEVQYFADFFNFGPFDKMKNFWNYPQIEGDESMMFTEQYLCYKDTGLKFPKYEDISNRYAFCYKELYKRGIELNWTKPGRDWGDHVKRASIILIGEIQ